MKKAFSILLFVLFILNSQAKIRVGADQTEKYLPLLKGKRIGLVINQTSVIGKTHLLDSLLSVNVDVKKVFTPEHGFRGDKDAGAEVSNGIDNKTGVPIISIYGKNKKPTAEQLNDIDIVVFDIQDVGTRFYTYLSTLHYVMEACAENNKLVIVLDRPNPNDYIDGPVLKNKRFQSFVGIHPIPILHGCTLGELALMINGEKWLSNSSQCQLKVISIEGWQHKQPYSILIKPSPNLTNDRAIMLYPSLCLFEGTDISVGRGTEFPFQVIGSTNKQLGDFQFVPKPIIGMDTNPLHKDTICYGIDLRSVKIEGGFHLKYLLDFYNKSENKERFFTQATFFDKLAGSDLLRKQIIKGYNENKIRHTWLKDLIKYNHVREKYLLYDDLK